jgi:hypothetical protein
MNNETETITCKINKPKVRSSLFEFICMLILGAGLIGGTFLDLWVWARLLCLVVGIILTVFAIPAVLNFTRLLVGNKSILILDSKGININISMFKKVTFLWEDISSISRQEAFIVIYPKDVSKYLSVIEGINRWIGWNFFLSHGPWIKISLIYLNNVDVLQLP